MKNPKGLLSEEDEIVRQDLKKTMSHHESEILNVQRNFAGSSARGLADNLSTSVNLHHAHCIIGQSAFMRHLKTYLLKVAKTDSTVLITGETGTGKELTAEAIHQYSSRQHKPFICINCAALPENLIESELFGYDKGAFTGAYASKHGDFEQANGGTVFLDEIGDMSSCAQAKILRTIESKEINHLGGKKSILVDVRIIAATNHEPERLLQEGKFREDLFYRLNVARIHLPPLRDHKEDIPYLIHWYIQAFNQQFGKTVTGFTKEALDLLMHYDWPGNIRELKNLLEATFINLPCEKISIVNLPDPFRKRLQETEELPRNERERLLSALFVSNWNKSKAAQRLHWSRMTVYRKMVKYNISRNSP
ncbi:transcriptional regulatory protein zraR [Candidatus Vecturithrix granuli]|uniref:Transcriptional regulatory protein zraR n=1 Tax=Vecturithrix granuli TaxID=1499967 RepID=A0A081C203_VECG1|nr:transcriptional regulatory protein zraR [Candidatus Vecturithrix granuli]